MRILLDKNWSRKFVQGFSQKKHHFGVVDLRCWSQKNTGEAKNSDQGTTSGKIMVGQNLGFPTFKVWAGIQLVTTKIHPWMSWLVNLFSRPIFVAPPRNNPDQITRSIYFLHQKQFLGFSQMLLSKRHSKRPMPSEELGDGRWLWYFDLTLESKHYFTRMNRPKV